LFAATDIETHLLTEVSANVEKLGEGKRRLQFERWGLEYPYDEVDQQERGGKKPNYESDAESHV
jgi:hypothetical protein